MVAMVLGGGMGLQNGSLASLGRQGQLGEAAFGRNGEKVYVNAGNGNLLLQQRDEFLKSAGLDLSLLRTYNSQGRVEGGSGVWRLGVARQVTGLQGGFNQAGSSVRRIGEDGSSALYRYDAGRQAYIGQDGEGADDLLRYDAVRQQWTWTDGATQLSETYDAAAGGRLLLQRDRDGKTLRVIYNAAGQVTRLESSGGEQLAIDYDAQGNITQLRTLWTENGVSHTRTRVRYGYDAQQRLSSVSVDLSPEDGRIDDGKVYTTRYGYDGDSSRLASLSQSDGSRLEFAYRQVGGEWRVSEVRDLDSDGSVRRTRFDYDVGKQQTTITDAAGLQSVWRYDAQGRLLEASSGGQLQLRASYDAQGRVLRLTDARGQATDYQYDERGNRILERDALGQTVRREYDAENRLLSETRYTGLDPDGAGPQTPAGAQTARYVYDAQGRLRFQIDPGGGVTEWRYDALGRPVSQLRYLEGVGQQKTDLAKLTAWAAGQPPERVSRSDSVYDLRGLLSETVRYARLDAKGQGVRDGGEQRVRYLYDQHGNLLQQWDGRGASVQYRYDGLNRLTRQTDALGNSTVTVYLDAKRQTQVTLANGLTMLRQYDSAGRLLAQTEQDAGGPLGSTRYLYDAMGRLLRSTDPTGQHQYQLYDAQGRKQAEIDATGALTEIRYNAVNQIIRRTRYANRIDLSLLGKDPARWSLETLRPQAGNDDRIEHLLYDAAGRLARSIDASGAVIDTHYDGRGQIIGTTRYAAWLDAKQQQALQAHEGELSLDNANARVAANGQDRAERRLYDAAGRLQAELDGEGYLTEHRYNSAGQRLASLRYATAAPASARARGGLDALRPQPDAQDQTVSYYYDGHGQQTGEVDAEGYLNETRYDAAGRVQQHIRYANRAKAGDTLAARRPAVNANDQGLLYEYDAAGRLTQQLRQPDGFTTRYQYDSQGRLTQTVRQAGEDSRSQLQRYDKQGRLIAELAGEGVQALAALGGAPSQARVDAVWSRWGSRHYYDAAGRRTATLSPNGVDGQGERTLYFYNAAGLQTHTVNALGEVSDTRYDAFGQIVGQLSYDRRLSAAQLSGLSGGLQSQIAPLLLELAQAGFSRQSYQYGRRGALFSQTDALGRETDRWTYNAFGERQDHTRLDGGRQQLLYDRRGLVVQQQDDVDGLKLQRQTRYDAFGRAWEQTDPRGRIQRREYDRLGRQIVSQDASGARQQTVYDAFGRVLEHTDALGYVTRSRYDDKTGRLTVTDANGIATVTERNGHGDVVTVIDGRGHATRYQYDRDGRRIGQNKPLGYSEQWQYNSAGRLMESRDANGARTVYVYDAVGRVLQRTIDPTGLKLSSRTEYDARGRVLRQIDANGGVTETRYDANGRVMETVRDATGLKLATAYRYDGQGRTVSVTEAAGTKQARTTEYRYDRQGRRLSEILDPGGAKLTTRYGYDGNGNVTSQTDAGGNVTRYVYDANNRQVYSIDALGYVVETAYDAAGQILRTTRYAQALKPSLLASPDALADPAPHLTASAADQTERRVYDKAGRLLQRIDPQGYLTQYSYDKGGNLAWVSRFANAVQGTFIDGQLVARLDSLPDSGAPAGAYLLTGGADRGEFQLYDALGRLQLSRDARGYATEYQYDAAGLLQQRTQYANPVQKKTSTNQMPARIDRIEQAPADGSSYILRSAADRKEFFAYDTAGRAVFSVDAEGYATRRSYDGLGNVVETRRHANKSIANLGWMQVNQTLYAYLFGRAADSPSLLHDKAAADPAARADALMASAEFEKKVGKLDPPKLAAWIYQTVYNRAGTAQELEAAVARLNGGESRGSVFWSLLQQADIQQVAPSADIGRALNDWRVLAEGTSYRRNDQVSRQQFDAAGRLTHSVDAAGYVTAYRYDAAGQRVETRRYAQRLWPEPDAQNSAEANAEWVDYNKRLYAYVLGRAPANLEELNARAANQSERAQALLSSPEFETRHGKLDDAAFIDWAFRRIVVRTPSQSERNTWQTNLGPNGISRGELVKYLLSWRLELKRPVEQDIRQAQNDWRVLAQIKTSAQDQVVRTAYDAAGRLISETRGDGNKLAAATRYQLDAQGKRVVETDANGRTTRRDYDLLGRLIRETDALGGVTATEYDAFGNAVKITDPRGYSGYNYYDALGRQTLHVDPEGYATGTEYDALGNTTRITRYATRVDTAALKPGVAPTLIVDAQRDAVTRIEHDALGHQTVLTDAEGGVEKMAYDAFGNKTVYTNQLGGGYHYIYDAQGRVLKETSPLGIVKRFEYDGFGNRTLQVEAEGKPEQRTTRYQYDGNNRLTRQTGDAVPIYTLDGGEATVSPSQSWRYDAAGRQIEFTDANGKITRSRYDALGRKVAERNGDGVLSEWDYDAAGNVKAQRVYASPVGLPAEGGVPAPANADVRETRYVYDG
ncbi:DUF4214 domain-containing protein, partial [Chromobacterium alkanivorans]|uniref:DUF4214 domain-containing protein n=1 Tax=Chromobacterium alkanivorans TaxID=1071719 RepID=UPI00216A8BED